MRPALAILVLLLAAEHAEAVTLARGGKAVLPIVLAREALPAERTAANELASYLGRVTSGRFEVVLEESARAGPPAIFVGPTDFARQLGLDPAALGPEEWRIRTVADSLVLDGGRPRGTLYAVYRFLEDHAGVRFFTPFEESVPKKKNFELGPLDERGRPAFPYRDVTTIGDPSPSVFSARNRINGDNSQLDWAHGGREAYGPPQPAHSFFAYVPPAAHFAAHPEYFAELDGERSDRGQLCMSNPELLDLVEARLRAFIGEGRRDAQAAGEPPPRLFTFSQNDTKGSCTCASCAALAEREGGQAGPLVAFLNELSTRIGPDYPDVRLDTLAYLQTFKPPRELVLQDAVVVRLSALQYRDFTRPVADPQNASYQRAIDGWRRVTRHLRIWDYSVAFGRDGDLPLANLRWLAQDYRYYLEHGVEGMFVQHDHPISADLRDLKLWVLAKLLEDPYRSYPTLLVDFTDGYYGRAGELIRAYLEALEAATDSRPSKIGYPARAADYHYLDGEFLVRAQRIFDRAERKARHHPVLARRVRHARLSLDRATLARWDELEERADAPALRKVVLRYRRTWSEQIELRGSGTEKSLAEVDREIGRLLARQRS